MTAQLQPRAFPEYARPLYIESRVPVRIDLDGPALKISETRRKVTHVPLRLISRMIMSESVRFSSEVLLACAQRGIVMLMVDADGAPLARVLGCTGQQQTFAQRLLDLTTRPDWQERYDNWLLSMRRRISTTLVNRLEAPRYLAAHPGQLDAWIAQALDFMSDDKSLNETAQALQRITYAWMFMRLQELGLGADSEEWQTAEIDLVQDLSRLLAARVQIIRFGFHRRRHEWLVQSGRKVKPVERVEAVALFEKAMGRIDKLGADIVNRLHRWLVQMN